MRSKQSRRIKLIYIPIIILFCLTKIKYDHDSIQYVTNSPSLTKVRIMRYAKNDVSSPCHSNPCLNGLCFTRLFGYKCICFEDFNGTNCEFKLDSSTYTAMTTINYETSEPFEPTVEYETSQRTISFILNSVTSEYSASSTSNSIYLLSKTYNTFLNISMNLNATLQNSSNTSTFDSSVITHNINSVAILLKNISRIKINQSSLSESEQKQQSDLFVNVVNLCIDQVGNLNSTTKLSNATTSITKSLENYSTNAINLTKYSISTENLSLVTYSLANMTESSDGFRADVNSTGLELVSSLNQTISINSTSQLKVSGYLNFTVLSNATNWDQSTRIYFGVYENSFLFDSNTSQLQKINSSKDCSCIDGDQIVTNVISISTNRVINTSLNFVNAQFRTLPVASLCNFSSFEYKCVYWDYSKSKWSSNGCQYVEMDENLHKCECNHLTSFAILMSFSAAKNHCEICETILEYVTYVGTGFSICGLLMTIGIYLRDYIRKQKPSGNDHAFKFMFDYYIEILIILSACLLAMDVIYIVFSLVTWDSHLVTCMLFGVLLHYFMLCSFFWMLCLAILQYLIFNKVLVVVNSYSFKSAIFCFGVPLIPIVVILAVDWQLYKHPNFYCWLSGYPAIFGLITPVSAVLVFNIMTFSLIMKKHCNIFNSKKSITPTTSKNIRIDNNGKNKVSDNARQTIILSTCFINMGLTWSLGFLLLLPIKDTAKSIMATAFCILNSFQGFLMFAIYILFSKARRNQLKVVAMAKFTKLKSTLYSSTSNQASEIVERNNIKSSTYNEMLSHTNTDY